MNIEINNIPENGYLYAVGEKLFFSPYQLVNGHILLEDQSEFQPDDYLEIHFFNEKAEYRILKDGRNSESSAHSLVLTEEDDINNMDCVTIREEEWIKSSFCPEGEEWKLVVLNRFEYTDNDRLSLTAYRLAGVIR